VFTFNEAISLQVNCATQDEIDYCWEKLSAAGDSKAQQCGRKIDITALRRAYEGAGV
jgi:predicted 3-demethylubiquinone-9 3-methyltransferase (glyoxalase superfamily)